MKRKILITGGAGFIGTNLLSAMDDNDWDVTVLDSLLPQVHPSQRWVPPQSIKFIEGDVCNRRDVRKGLDGAEYIIHLAAETGVGQSAYELARHVKTNEYGTALLLEEASRQKNTVKGVIVASSRAVYGEGMVICCNCGPVTSRRRESCDLLAGRWETLCSSCRSTVGHLPSKEEHLLDPTSVYGVTKINQEQLLQQFSVMFDVPGVALRFQNVYGPGQSLNNPYTGILAVFSTRALSGNPIYIYEDGQESRDFVYVDDAVQAIQLVLEKGFTTSYQEYNVGSGKRTAVIDIAKILVDNLNTKVPINISGKYRAGDIRHASADISKIQNDFAYKPRFDVETGLKLFTEWVKTQPLPFDQYDKTEKELSQKGLLLQKESAKE